MWLILGRVDEERDQTAVPGPMRTKTLGPSPGFPLSLGRTMPLVCGGIILHFDRIVVKKHPSSSQGQSIRFEVRL